MPHDPIIGTPVEVGRRKNGLLPSCEPCRKSKQSCDHVQPVCGRCSKKKMPDKCNYHPAPMTTSSKGNDRYRVAKRPRISTPSSSASPPASDGNITSKLKLRKELYPDPGYLGSSSSNAVFQEIQGQIPVEGTILVEYALSKDEEARAELLNKRDSTKIKAGAELLALFCDLVDLDLFDTLITRWYNQALGCSLTSPVIGDSFRSVKKLALRIKRSKDMESELLYASENILRNTLESVKTDRSTTFAEYIGMFTEEHLRWEAVGLVFTVIGLSAIALHPADSLFCSRSQKQKLCKQALDASDACFACCDVDQLNDFRVWFLYENMILVSLYYGDLSFHTWSRIGDLSSEAFALGLHQEIKPGAEVPFFLAELRKRTFAQIYCQDKMIATITGRPCRVSRKFCVLQMPLDLEDKCLGMSAEELQPYLDNLDEAGWNKSLEVRRPWRPRSALLNSEIRESILELILGADNTNLEAQLAHVRQLAEEKWAKLPDFVRFDRIYDDLEAQEPQARRLYGAYLDHLYNLFLIEQISMKKAKNSSARLLTLAREILKVVLSAINMRGEAALLPGCLAWYTSAHALPAAGVLALELLQQTRQPSRSTHSSTFRSETIQNLSVLVSHLGVIIPPGEGNYVLLNQARKMIQAILDVVLAGPRTTPPHRRSELLPSPSSFSEQLGDEFGNDWGWFDQLEFTGDFWNSVAEHPLLAPLDQTLHQ